MAKKTLKSITDFYDWDVDVVRIMLSALKFIRKIFITFNFQQKVFWNYNLF